MKTKDMVELAVSAGIFVVIGIFAYSNFVPKSNTIAKNQVTIPVVTSINSTFDTKIQDQLRDPLVARDFSAQVDLTVGLGNAQPFNPLQ